MDILYLAIEPSEGEKDQIMSYMNSLRGKVGRGEPTSRENLFLDIAYPYPVKDIRLLRDAMDEVTVPPFQITLSRINCSPAKKYTSGCFGLQLVPTGKENLWIRAEPNSQLMELYQQQYAALAAKEIKTHRALERLYPPKMALVRDATLSEGVTDWYPTIEISVSRIALVRVEKRTVVHRAIAYKELQAVEEGSQ